MRMTIIRSDGMMGVDGRFLAINTADLPANVHAVQWDTDKGHVEHNDGTLERKITNVGEFAVYYQRWEAARNVADAPPSPPTPEEVADAADRAQVRADQAIVSLMLSNAQTINDQIRSLLGDLTTAPQRNALITLQVRQTQILAVLARTILR